MTKNCNNYENDENEEDSNYKKFLKYSWKYANLYKIYENENEKYNNIHFEKIKEYRNIYINASYSYENSNYMAYNIVHKSITLQKQYKYVEKVKKDLNDIDIIYSKLYNILYKN